MVAPRARVCRDGTVRLSTETESDNVTNGDINLRDGSMTGWLVRITKLYGDLVTEQGRDASRTLSESHTAHVQRVLHHVGCVMRDLPARAHEVLRRRVGCVTLFHARK